MTEHLDAGEYPLSFELKPLVPIEKQIHPLDLRVDAMRIEGPLEEDAWVAPANYARFFPDGPPPPAGPERDAYAHKVLGQFATRAFRRPVDDASVDKLAALAKLVYDQPGKSFEEGIGQAMVAVLSSPRFLFRVEEAGPMPPGKSYPLVDEYALASRLSYFLWTTMPDEELIDLAGRGQLRANLAAQLSRMLADPRSDAFVRNFVGQWLQARDVETISIDPIAALGYQQEWEAMLDEFRTARMRDRRERHQLEQRARPRTCRRGEGWSRSSGKTPGRTAPAGGQKPNRSGTSSASWRGRNSRNLRRSATNSTATSATPCAAKRK